MRTTSGGGLGDLTLVAGPHRFVLQAVAKRDGTPLAESLRARIGTDGRPAVPTEPATTAGSRPFCSPARAITTWCAIRPG